RCIRFTEEIAGIQELGMIGRGEHMKVRTYIETTVNHELSGNVIDLCPVGALVSKPYRFSARAWEMNAVPLVSPHDPVGTNLFGHVLRGRLMRVVPRENEAINETWIADRDRFSYEGIYSPDRLTTALLRRGASWVESDWERALGSLLVIGANLRREVPILAHRLRKAALRGAQVAMLNPACFPHLFPVRVQLTSAPADLVGDLAAVLAAAAAATGKSVPPQLASAVGEARVTDAHRAATQALLSVERRAVWMGALAARHASFAD